MTFQCGVFARYSPRKVPGVSHLFPIDNRGGVSFVSNMFWTDPVYKKTHQQHWELKDVILRTKPVFLWCSCATKEPGEIHFHWFWQAWGCHFRFYHLRQGCVSGDAFWQRYASWRLCVLMNFVCLFLLFVNCSTGCTCKYAGDLDSIRCLFIDKLYTTPRILDTVTILSDWWVHFFTDLRIVLFPCLF